MKKRTKIYYGCLSLIFFSLLLFSLVFFWTRRQGLEKKKDYDKKALLLNDDQKKEKGLKLKAFNDKLLKNKNIKAKDYVDWEDLGYIYLPKSSNYYFLGQDQEDLVYDGSSSLPLGGDWSITYLDHKSEKLGFNKLGGMAFLRPNDRFYLKNFLGEFAYQVRDISWLEESEFVEEDIEVNKNIIIIKDHRPGGRLRLVRAEKIKYFSSLEKYDKDFSKKYRRYIFLSFVASLIFLYLLPLLDRLS